MASSHRARQRERPGDRSRSLGPIIIMQRIQYRNEVIVKIKERKGEERNKWALAAAKPIRLRLSSSILICPPHTASGVGSYFVWPLRINPVTCRSVQPGSTARTGVNKGETQSVNVIANSHSQPIVVEWSNPRWSGLVAYFLCVCSEFYIV
ncbi:hypothetical protein BDZ45DRAFT_351147 [Acephala macrosclerotiorum]|nr:hypothetical protein BDZ45DRAFT_351147 [Acephala macrosclerotiorum]